MTVMIRQFPSFEHNQRSGAFRNWLRTVTVNQLRVLWRTRRNSCATGDSAVARMLDQLADPESSLSKLWDQQHDQHVAAKLMELIRQHSSRRLPMVRFVASRSTASRRP